MLSKRGFLLFLAANYEAIFGARVQSRIACNLQSKAMLGVPEYVLGIDFGTSGARAVVLPTSSQQTSSSLSTESSQDEIVTQVSHHFANNQEAGSALVWRQTLWSLIGAIALPIRSGITRIAINGTSATMLLCDDRGEPLTKPLMYNDAIARSILPTLSEIAPSAS
ncbi:MAG: hypothetical protein AAFU53_11010, partial [Cyanobacteria bacterium J06632_3]